MECCFDKGEKCSSLVSRSLGVRKIIKNGRKTVTVIPVIRV